MTVNIQGHDISINEKLLEEMGVEESLYEIIHVRLKLSKLLMLEKVDEFVGKEKELLDKITNLDYGLQTLWGFARDRSYHTYEWMLSHCLCAKMDNLYSRGSGITHVNGKCPYHGCMK